MTNDQWEYLGALNQCISIVLCIAIGFVMAHFKVFEVEAFLPIFTQYLFYVALPFHVFSGLGIVIDLYNDLFLWDFIGAFIVLRGIALLVCLSIVWIQKKGGMGDAAVMWLNMTWISTVLGIPVVNAIIPGQGGFFGVLAGMSVSIM
jgi:predicted permease